MKVFPLAFVIQKEIPATALGVGDSARKLFVNEPRRFLREDVKREESLTLNERSDGVELERIICDSVVKSSSLESAEDVSDITSFSRVDSNKPALLSFAGEKLIMETRRFGRGVEGQEVGGSLSCLIASSISRVCFIMQL